jgi:Holliday junction resolvase RusA-like endonuclease
VLRFEVNGKAQPAGSKRAFVRGGRAQVVDANKGAAPWKNAVADAAARARGTNPLIECAVIVDVFEWRLRPKSHYGKRGLNAAGRAKPYPTSAPDTGKIARGVHDGLAGAVLRDDAQIVDGRNVKRWGDREHTLVLVAIADDRADLIARYRIHEAIAAQEAAERQEALSA